MAGLSESRRLAALDAMGVQSYISRKQLPGAAVTRRLAIVSPAAPAQDVVAPSTAPSRDAKRAANIIDVLENDTAVHVPGARRNREAAEAVATPLRFSLAAVVAGNWLWLEEVDPGAVSTEQLLLMQAMAGALHMVAGGEQNAGSLAVRPQVEYFNWPLHNNRQLDQSENAARSGVAGFIRRRLEQRACNGLVLLGETCRERVPLEQLSCDRVVSTVSTARMLADPVCKKQVWRDLREACLKT